MHNKRYIHSSGRQRLIDIARNNGWHTVEEMARHSGVKARHFRNILAGRSPLSDRVQRAFVEEFGVADEELAGLCRAERAEPRLPSGRAPNEKDANRYTSILREGDWKNIIYERDVSDRLLQGGEVDLATAASATVSHRFSEQSSDKWSPMFASLDYNHFVSLSAIITLHWSGQHGLAVIGYHRDKESFRRPETDGPSVLFSGSFLFRCHHKYPGLRTPMDRWFELLAHGEDAAAAFCEGDNAVLRAVIAHKIQFPDYYRTRIAPFGVLTRQERRSDGRKRATTMFVFNVKIEFDAEPKSMQAEAQALPSERKPLVCLDETIEPSAWFKTEGGDPLRMDLLAWKALTGSAPHVSSPDGSTVFTRNFRLSQ